MKLAYYSTGHPIDIKISQQLRERGHELITRNQRFWQGETEDCDAVIVKSFRNDSRKVVEAYQKPFVVIDWGYIRRVSNSTDGAKNYWQVSLNGLNNPPAGEFKSDRFDELGVEIKTRQAKKDGYVLVCGQMPLDGAVIGSDHTKWLQGKIEELQQDGEDVRYREHPRGGVKIGHVPNESGPLEDVLSGAKYIVCYNSNIGHDALLLGVPVVCDDSAPYVELSGVKCPAKAKRQEYFNRLAYGQWKADEIGEGIALVLEQINDN